MCAPLLPGSGYRPKGARTSPAGFAIRLAQAGGPARTACDAIDASCSKGVETVMEGSLKTGESTGRRIRTRRLGLLLVSVLIAGVWAFLPLQGVQAIYTLPSDRVAWWQANGNALETSGTYNGTLMNGVTFAPGVAGQAFHFDGLASHVRVDSSGILKGASQATIVAWVRREGPAGNGGGYGGQVFAENTGMFDWTRFGINVLDDGSVFALGRPTENGALKGVTTSAKTTLGKWAFVAATWKSDEGIKVYINGTLAGSLSESVGSFTSSDSDYIGIGGSNAGAPGEAWYVFNGDVDEVQVFTRALGASEIQAIYSGTRPKATVYGPYAPSTMYKGKKATIYGYVGPKHTTGTYLVTLKFYKRNASGVYVYHHSVKAKRYYYSAAKTKYKVSTSLPHTGKWRVQALHTDTGPSTSYSGYKYITVK
jgi:hypothetical protein